jgi:hypothetical protein
MIEDFGSLMDVEGPWRPGDFLLYEAHYDDGDIATWRVLALDEGRTLQEYVFISTGRVKSFVSSVEGDSPRALALREMRRDVNHARKSKIICFVRGER